MPLPLEGHLSVMVEGGTSSVANRRISQLEVCQLLSLGSQVVYLAGFNGCQVPVITSLPESLARGATLLGGEPAPPTSGHLAIHHKGAGTQSFAIWWPLNAHPNCKPHQGSSSQGRREGQHDLGGERASILGGTGYFWACIGEFHPKEARTSGPSHTSTSKWEDLTKLVDTSS